jgi:lysozyme
MKTSTKGKSDLAKEEGTKTKAYLDSVGVWTVGTGHTSAAGPPKVTEGLVITKAEAMDIFTRDLAKYEAAVNKAITEPMTQNQFDAMVSLCYNVGPTGFAHSSIVSKFNAGDIEGAADAFLLYKRAGNKPNILLARRKRERAIFLGKAPTVTKKVAKAPAKAVEASKQSPIATGAVITGGTAAASQLLPSIGSWEAVVALGVIIVAAGIGWFIYKHYRDK